MNIVIVFSTIAPNYLLCSPKLLLTIPIRTHYY